MASARSRLPSAFALVTAFASTAGAVPLLTGFGGPTGYGLPEHCLHPNDDGSYAGPRPGPDATPAAIDLRPAFPDGLTIFGRTFDHFYLNTNGNITFDAPLARPDALPLPITGQTMIAPWWADVDTRGGGQPSGNAICYHLEPNRLVVTWHDVGRHAVRNDRRNDFQLIVSTSSTCSTFGDLDVEFRYNRCGWAAGDGPEGLPGTPALVGFDAGDRTHFVALAQSRTAAIAELCTTSNVPGGSPGLYRFQVRAEGFGDACSPAGIPCDVPWAQGICASGYTTCVDLHPVCVSTTRPRARRCNGLDNDCDGAVDDGPCPGAQACDQGLCRDRCASDARCAGGLVCSARGTCVAADCAGVACPAGERCQQGRCVDACAGVTCPHGTACRAGHCADPCEGVICDGRELCDGTRPPGFGLCGTGCQCAPCGDGQSCLPDGRCVEDACADVTCPSDAYCEHGACIDRCATSGARPCLDDELCRGGRCLSAEEAAAEDAAAAAAASARDGGRAGGGGVDGGGVDGGVAVTGTVLTGCGCRVGGGRSRAAAWVVVGLAGVFARRRRRSLR